MSLNIETTQGLERRVTITVPAETVVQAIREELKRVAKNARIDGFRKGKVPPHIIEKRFGASVRQDILGDLLQNHFFQAVIENKINHEDDSVRVTVLSALLLRVYKSV